MNVFALTRGDIPFVMSIPHLGQAIPDEIAERMTPEALRVPDTDWDLDRLYAFAGDLGVHIIQANFSRYVIDLNRAPDNRPLYAGADNTELVPLSTFAGAPIYQPAMEPGTAEIDDRLTHFWQPYHTQLGALLEDLKAHHGRAVLFDCHSIKSQVPRFFDGALPDINLGTADGISCAPGLQKVLEAELSRAAGFTLAVNGRFKGGYITRHFGAPHNGIDAYQVEHSTAAYMDETPWFAYRDDLAGSFQAALRPAFEAAVNWALSAGGR